MNYQNATKKVVDQTLRQTELEMWQEEERKIRIKVASAKKKVRDHHAGFVSAKKYLVYRSRWINHLEKIHPEIKYVSGYKMQKDNSKSFQVLVQDRKTGIRFSVASSKLRKPTWKPHLEFIPPRKVFKEDRQKWYPIANRNCWGQLIVNSKIKPIVFLQCRQCGKTFQQKRGADFCSSRCYKIWHDRWKSRQKSKRTKTAKTNGTYDISITLEKLYKRDKGVCYICGKHLVLNDDYNRPDAPTIEHVIPIAKGGTHTWDNVKLACRNCNNHKGTKTYQEYLKSEALKLTNVYFC